MRTTFTKCLAFIVTFAAGYFTNSTWRRATTALDTLDTTLPSNAESRNMDLFTSVDRKRRFRPESTDHPSLHTQVVKVVPRDLEACFIQQGSLDGALSWMGLEEDEKREVLAQQARAITELKILEQSNLKEIDSGTESYFEIRIPDEDRMQLADGIAMELRSNFSKDKAAILSRLILANINLGSANVAARQFYLSNSEGDYSSLRIEWLDDDEKPISAISQTINLKLDERWTHVLSPNTSK